MGMTFMWAWWDLGALAIFPGVPLVSYFLAAYAERQQKRANMVRVRDWTGENQGLPRWVDRYSEDHLASAFIEATLDNRTPITFGMHGVTDMCCRDLLTDAEHLALEAPHDR